MVDNNSIRGRWEKLDSQRAGILNRARDCAKLTLPTLLPPAGHTELMTYPTPFQSLGARAVNTLSAKLLLALLPPNAPFFRLIPDEFALDELVAEQPDVKEQVDHKISTIERNIASEVERQALRVPTFEFLKLLVGTGNALLFKTPGSLKVFRLDQYVVKRDPMGTPLEIIVKESISKKALDSKIREALTSSNTDETVDLFTKIELHDTSGKYIVTQEAGGIEIVSARGEYTKDNMPWLPQRWSSISGEDYGRGITEEYLGDLRSLEALTQAIVEGAAAAAKILFLVKPNGTTNIRDLARAESGAFKPGNADDVSILQLDKFNDFRIAKEVSDEISNRLSQAFLMASSVSRNAERVTAEEIKYMAGELEDALGGVYSLLSQEFQLPLVHLLLKEKDVDLPKELVSPGIITGMEALGRGQDFTKLVTLGRTLGELFGPEVMAKKSKVDAWANRLGDSLSIDTSDLLLTDEELQAQAQQDQMQQLAMQGGGAMATQGGALAAQHLAGQLPTQQQPQG